jgi:hypothetical protein
MYLRQRRRHARTKMPVLLLYDIGNEMTQVFSEAELDELYERSKNDRAIITVAEVRQLIEEVRQRRSADKMRERKTPEF